MRYKNHLENGLTLIELMIAMAIGLVIVIAATVIYLSTAKNQRALERKSSSAENGTYALQALGKEILSAGFYPANFPPEINDVTQVGMYDTYPPLESNPRKNTDWQNSLINWPPIAYTTGIYGCEGGEFDVATATCPTPDNSKPDSIVINYFTSDALGGSVGRKDCTGSSADEDASNLQRIKPGKNLDEPPLLPLFVSNRYTVRDLKNFVDQNDVSTRSLSCSGNGSNEFGETSKYQPIIAGIKDMQFRYGVYADEKSLVPERFYDAQEVSNLPVVDIYGQKYTGWQRVSSVKVCVLSQSQGGGVRLQDQESSEMTYLDCDEQVQNQPVGQWVHKFAQIFGVRNGLKQSY